MNPHSAAVAGSGNPLKSRFESEIRAKIFAKSADPFAYSPPSFCEPFKIQLGLLSFFVIINFRYLHQLTLTNGDADWRDDRQVLFE